MPGRISHDNGDGGSLHHIILTMSKLKHDPTNEIQKVRVCGTYTSLPAANAEAHRCLFDLGYQREWFDTYDARRSDGSEWTHGDGVIVYAVAPDGDTFEVSIDTTVNKNGWKGNDEGEVGLALYHLLKTVVFYEKDAGGALRKTSVLDSFESYAKGRLAAQTALTGVDHSSKETDWAEYDVLPLEEKDWEFGENVVVHAVGQSGENVLLSVVGEQGLESVRIMEAAMRIR